MRSATSPVSAVSTSLTPSSRNMDRTELRKSEKSSTIRKLFWWYASIEDVQASKKMHPMAKQRNAVSPPGVARIADHFCAPKRRRKRAHQGYRQEMAFR